MKTMHSSDSIGIFRRGVGRCGGRLAISLRFHRRQVLAEESVRFELHDSFIISLDKFVPKHTTSR